MGAFRLARSSIRPFLLGTAILLVVNVAVVVALPGTAVAQQDAEKQVQRMNKRAMADYDSLEFELSRKTLMDAVSLLRQAGIDETPTAAKTYVNLGIVYVAGFKDRNRGMQQFVQALKISPNLKLDPEIATPELEEVFEAARKQVGPSVGSTPKPPEDGDTDLPPNDNVKGLQHTPVDEAKPGEPLTVKAQVGSDVGARSVVLLYRPSGQADFVTLPMKRSGSDYVAVIPGDAVGDHPFQYYIEARDANGKALVSAGSAANPYIVTMAEAAPGARIVHRTPKKAEDKDHFHRLFILAMLGTGVGAVPTGNKTEVAWEKSASTGLYQPASVGAGGGHAVIAPFHIGIEFGGWITRHFALSLLGRFEVVTGANAQTMGTLNTANNQYTAGAFAPGTNTTKAGGAVAGFLRARYRFLNGKIHPYLTVDLGGGEIRHQLNLGAAEVGGVLVDQATAQSYNGSVAAKTAPTTMLQVVCPRSGSCFDSIKMGDLFIGGGGGLWWDVQKYVALILDVNLLGGIGVGSGGQGGFNMDVQLGLGVHFL